MFIPPEGHEQPTAATRALLICLRHYLPTPSPAEGWIELYKRLSEAHTLGTDRDDILAPPNFGYSFSSCDWVTLEVPDVITREGSVLRVGGNDYGFRWIGTKATVDISRKHAAALLKNPAWRELNDAKALEMIAGEA